MLAALALALSLLTAPGTGGDAPTGTDPLPENHQAVIPRSQGSTEDGDFESENPDLDPTPTDNDRTDSDGIDTPTEPQAQLRQAPTDQVLRDETITDHDQWNTELGISYTDNDGTDSDGAYIQSYARPFTGRPSLNWALVTLGISPNSIAHNDFYDDQLVVLPDGRLALVGFEDIGLGDPMLDIGNFLAHSLWASRFGNQSAAESQLGLHAGLRSAALEKFGWAESELAMREAVCVFRICTNAIRRPRAAWMQRVLSGLKLVNEIAA